MLAYLNGIWERMRGAFAGVAVPAQRTSGRPTSANRASSFHLHWHLDAAEPILEAAVTVEVLEPPAVTALYFWALQATFMGPDGESGGAHIGLQWNPRHPDNAAVNWGGYHAQSQGGHILDGTESDLPSSPADRNTRDYPWRANRGYRLRILPAADVGWWRGEVTDLENSERTIVRDLHGGGDRLTGLVVWSEVFARCDDPRAAVLWSDPAVTLASGTLLSPSAVTVNYQAESAGGCSNTVATVSGNGILQATNTPRTTAQGAVLQLTGT